MKPPYKGNKDIALARRAVKSIFGNRIIKENYEEYEHSRWVHYSDHEMLTVNHKQFHQDPRGIYFFPESHNPDATMWHAKKYKYTVVLKPDAKVLDLPEISDRLLDKMVADIGATETFQGYITQYPPADHIKKIHMAWEMMRQKFSYSLWNKVIRNLGYDALFDDKGIIHSHEPIQLIVLNPRCISIVNREKPKSNYFPKMVEAMKEVVELAKQYGKVEIEQPKLVNRYGNKTLTGYVTINDWEHKPYARITFTRSNDKNFSHLVQVSVTSSPHLSGSLGANYDSFKNEWQSYSNIETLKRGLDTIFHSDENSPRNEWGLT